MTLTENQAAAMTALIKSCLNNMGGKNINDLMGDPFTWAYASDLVDAGWSQKQAEGTFGSLVAEGLVHHNEGTEYFLTSNWDELRKYHA